MGAKENRSWQFNVAFWAITVPVFPVILILVIMVLINPFWFRMEFAGWVETKVNRFAAWRFERLKNLYYKDNFFDILKNPKDL